MVALPIAKYAASVWFEKAVNVTHRKHLLAAQRMLLIMNTSSTRTTSTSAMQVIAGTKPLDLSIIESGLKGYVRRNKEVRWNNYVYEEKENITKKEIEEEFLKIETEVMLSWQERWDNDEHGRHTYRFIKSVNFTEANT